MQQVILILVAQVWVCLLFLLACYGWGALLRRHLTPNLHPIFSLALGLAALLSLQGIASLFITLGQVSAIVIIGLGCALVVLELKKVSPLIIQSLRSLTRYDLLFILVELYAFTVLFVSSLKGFSGQADKVGYAVNVARFVDVGGYGPDPFNARIIESGLGGFNFLLGSLVALGLPLYQLPVMERFLAPAIGLFTLLGFCRINSLQRWECYGVAIAYTLLIFGAVSLDITNTLTGTLTMIPLYLLLLGIFFGTAKEKAPWMGRVLVLAMTVAAICSLKSTHIVSIALYAPILIILFERGSFVQRAAMGIVTALTAFALLIPFMLSLHASSGTYLYPIFGKGFHGSQYGIYYQPDLLRNLASHPVVLSALVIVKIFIVLGLLVIPYTILRYIKFPRERSMAYYLVLLYFSMALCAGYIIASTGYGRYGYTAAAIVVLTILTDAKRLFELMSKYWLFTSWVLVCATCATLLINSHAGYSRMYMYAKKGVRMRGLIPEIISRAEVIRAQQAIPKGSIILARIGQAYFLDFSRNTIWHMDIPGAASPPPGLPLHEGAKPYELAAYLRSVGVRYFLYSEKDSGGHPVKAFKNLALSNDDEIQPWMQSVGKNICLMDDLILGLIQEDTAIIYRQDGLIVIDLELRDCLKTPTSPRQEDFGFRARRTEGACSDE